MLNTLMMNIAESSYKLKENPAKWLKVRKNASGYVAVDFMSDWLKVFTGRSKAKALLS